MKRILTALVAAATPRRRGGCKFGVCGSALGLGLGPRRPCRRRRHRQRTGLVVLLSVRLLRAVSLSPAALRVAPCMERLRLGSCLRVTERSRELSGGKQLRRFLAETPPTCEW